MQPHNMRGGMLSAGSVSLIQDGAHHENYAGIFSGNGRFGEDSGYHNIQDHREIAILRDTPNTLLEPNGDNR